MPINYMLATDAAVVLNYKTVDQAVVKGLSKLSLPGGTRDVITMDEFRNEFARQFAGGGKYNDITYGGNFVTGDTKGQDTLRDWWLSRKKAVGAELMCFLNYDDFFTTDLANDESAGLQVADVSSSEAGKNDGYPLSGKLLPNGRLAIYSAHSVSPDDSTTLAFDSTAGTITDSGSGFVTAGFVAGMTALIIGSTSNDGVAALITEVAAGVLTLDVKIGTLATEAGANGCEVHGGRF